MFDAICQASSVKRSESIVRRRRRRIGASELRKNFLFTFPRRERKDVREGVERTKKMILGVTLQGVWCIVSVLRSAL